MKNKTYFDYLDKSIKNKNHAKEGIPCMIFENF
jgi:hypothetical protein